MPVQPRKYHHAVIATDVVILTLLKGVLHVLLIKMKKAPYTRSWAVPGGLVHVHESVDAAATRHLADKAGVRNVYLEQLYTFGKVKRDPFGRVVSVAYMALIPEPVKVRTTDEYADVRWFPIDALPPLAYDHHEIVQTALGRLRSKLGYSNIVYTLLPEAFTLTELQQTYQQVLQRTFDKRNFRKRVLSFGMIVSTGKQQSGGAHRPAMLYRFRKRSPQKMSVLDV